MNPMEPYLPEHMRGAMKKYLELGIQPGHFLTAVLENDLREACARADHINAAHLTNIVSYCYNEIPSAAWGSPEKVKDWIARIDKDARDADKCL